MNQTACPQDTYHLGDGHVQKKSSNPRKTMSSVKARTSPNPCVAPFSQCWDLSRHSVPAEWNGCSMKHGLPRQVSVSCCRNTGNAVLKFWVRVSWAGSASIGTCPECWEGWRRAGRQGLLGHGKPFNQSMESWHCLRLKWPSTVSHPVWSRDQVRGGFHMIRVPLQGILHACLESGLC